MAVLAGGGDRVGLAGGHPRSSSPAAPKGANDKLGGRWRRTVVRRKNMGEEKR